MHGMLIAEPRLISSSLMEYPPFSGNSQHSFLTPSLPLECPVARGLFQFSPDTLCPARYNNALPLPTSQHGSDSLMTIPYGATDALENRLQRRCESGNLEYLTCF
ncbi:uncharacterized protein EI90DRAFT_3043035 [Cantharellus anzutake]|uniref:uncharacterized protein n=1 Tax=Cantharellus anzutake TaxID=1750568 RepID=UPI001905F286|nr:uncharacterized protein EI90DRAFT_3043035 [Cantharellus anzutake]KAF8337452.1 hypothetical protein EI90DRAFT_3043035 [Cantharellus anzutake]